MVLILVIWRSHAQTKIVIMAHISSLEFMAQIREACELGLQNASPVIGHENSIMINHCVSSSTIIA
jgi:hypothetical protein